LRFSKTFVWKCQYAVRVKSKGRARGEIITRDNHKIRKAIKEISVEEVKVIDGIQAELRRAAMENNNDS